VIWLLDTNIFIPALNGRPSVRARLNEAEATGEVVTSVLVLGELLYGAKCSKRSGDNIRAVENELTNVAILPVTADIIRLFSDLKASLRKRGIVKSDIDLVIATTALHHGATLVTDDQALLTGDIPGLFVENWV
jgi:tRNA(fMet)-specific endonuclease VapC